jgi:ElaB/YqjD/DUF883 family membrane-anchored ribosome-binding protein
MESRSKELGNDARTLGREAAETVKETAQDWAEQARAAGEAAYHKAQAAYEYAQDKAIAGARMTDQAIRENPYKALGVAFGVGLLIGFLVKRR